MEILSATDRRRQALDKIRSDRLKTIEELKTVSEASLSLDETIQRVFERLQAEAERAQQSILAFARPSFTPDIPAFNAGFMLWLNSAEFQKDLRARLKPLLPSTSISSADRQRRLAALRPRVVELEEMEEREICRLEQQGLIVDRRDDADLDVVLRVWDTLESVAA